MSKHPAVINKDIYVKYKNKFKLLKIKTEKNYYASEFHKYNGDLKQTWKLLDLFFTHPATSRK